MRESCQKGGGDQDEGGEITRWKGMKVRKPLLNYHMYDVNGDRGRPGRKVDKVGGRHGPNM